ncbi:MAG: glycine--tRNA ligase subunit beta [Fimbriimonadaceae bacterium]|nr:glycine--tRNA ligase subunit beta [Fimbriimonadaceae bacterium]
MPELLFELGCEELPATFVRKAFHQLEHEITGRLREAQVPFASSRSLGTPRRLIVVVEGLAERQPDRFEEKRGPALAAAFGTDGVPTKALEGFCRGCGVTVDAVKPKDGYVWVTKRVEGRATQELLSEILPASVRALTFDKTMRWGKSRMRFVRPIRWMLACLGGQTVPFAIEGVAAGSVSRGHRFYAPDEFEVRDSEGYLAGLRARFVEPDPTVREARIREGAATVASGRPDMDDALVEENVFLTEWPTAIEGAFREEYLELPEAVLVVAMARHERFFPVRGHDGRLTNRFVSIRNGGADDVVREGNAWVLSARYNDAKFFYDEDRKRTLDDFLEKTDGILFQEKLGTVRERADRLSDLCAAVAGETGADKAETDHARKAGLYAKADLSTGLVSELASLQGVIGGEYARRAGLPEPVCRAIAAQYGAPTALDPTTAEGRAGLRLIVADQLDKLAGYLGLGLAPTGSSDPFGLRRAVTTLIHAAWHWPGGPLSYKALFDYANLNSPARSPGSLSALCELFASRYEALLPDAAHDVRLAATRLDDPREVLSPRRLRLRVAILERLRTDVAFVQAATRPLNIVRAAVKKGVEVPRSEWVFEHPEAARLESAEGHALARALVATRSQVDRGFAAEAANDVATALLALKGPINAFFDATMVMVDDPEVRGARLSLLDACSNLLLHAGDFGLLVVEG